jgi:hypothetical protein
VRAFAPPSGNATRNPKDLHPLHIRITRWIRTSLVIFPAWKVALALQAAFISGGRVKMAVQIRVYRVLVGCLFSPLFAIVYSTHFVLENMKDIILLVIHAIRKKDHKEGPVVEADDESSTREYDVEVAGRRSTRRRISVSLPRLDEDNIPNLTAKLSHPFRLGNWEIIDAKK